MRYINMSSQQQNVVEVMDLTVESQIQKAQQQAIMQQMEVRKAMTFSATTTTSSGGTGSSANITVPTLPAHVRATLRQLGLPVRLFGENLADIRQRLRYELVTRQIVTIGSVGAIAGTEKAEDVGEEEQVTKYTRAIPELLQARQAMTIFSLQRASIRLTRERQLRQSARIVQQQQKRKRLPVELATSKTTTTTTTDENHYDNDDDVNATLLLDKVCRQTYQSCRKLCLTASQFGDVRSLSAICATQLHDNTGDDVILATSSWTGSIHLWNGTTAAMTNLGTKSHCHLDRIMWMDIMNNTNTTSNMSSTGACAGSNNNTATSNSILLATASIDMTAKLWKVQKADDENENVVMKEDHADDDNGSGKDNDDNQDKLSSTTSSSSYTITEMVHFKGHAARLCRTAFHPMQRHVGTTSFDYTWRLWDIETGQNLLLQDGHAGPVFDMAFHDDGSLCCTTDFVSVVQLWDLRTGKSIQHYAGMTVGGHVKRVTCCDFSPNGIHLATAGDDGTIKIWDLRKRPSSSSSSSSSATSARVAKNALVANIPAHSRLVTRVKFEHGNNNSDGSNGSGSNIGGEYLVSSSFDGLAKIWSARDWKLLKELHGHTGPVSCVDILPNSYSSGGDGGVGIVTCGFDKTLKLWK